MGPAVYYGGHAPDGVFVRPAPAPMGAPRIIAFVGPSGVGKSTAAQALAQLGYARESIAYPIKQMLAKLLHVQGVSRRGTFDAVYGPQRNEENAALAGKTPRQAMQTLGMEWGRGVFGDDFWIDSLLSRIAPPGLYAIDDVRFPNEAAKLKAIGAYIIRVERQGVGFSLHASERAWMDIPADAVLYNNWRGREAWQEEIFAFVRSRFGGRG